MNNAATDVPNPRTSDFPIDPIFLARWSPRAFTPDEIGETQLLTLLEAARWAPSGYNAQPWRFVYVHRRSLRWQAALDLLSSYNRGWAQAGSALVFVGSHASLRLPGTDDPTELATHSFDAGAAWAFLALQAAKLGIATHAVGGFDRTQARDVLNAPAGFDFHAAVVIGQRGDPAALPEKLASREGPSDRQALAQIAFADAFPASSAIADPIQHPR